jgi:hypothetical protein
LDVMYFPSRTSGSDRGDECIYATSLL